MSAGANTGLASEAPPLRETPNAPPRAVARPPWAERIAAGVGSWPFIGGLTLVLAAWIAVNLGLWFVAWDPYPFILLNLFLSFQTAYTAPIILMSQNREAAADRARAIADYAVNVRAEAEVAEIQRKLDALVAEVRALRDGTSPPPPGREPAA